MSTKWTSVHVALCARSGMCPQGIARLFSKDNREGDVASVQALTGGSSDSALLAGRLRFRAQHLVGVDGEQQHGAGEEGGEEV